MDRSLNPSVAHVVGVGVSLHGHSYCSRLDRHQVRGRLRKHKGLHFCTTQVVCNFQLSRTCNFRLTLIVINRWRNNYGRWTRV